jgi:polyhydroxyalkanoate synthesis regulator phasin
MFEAMQKIFLAGLGLMTLPPEKARAIVEMLIAQGQLTQEEGRRLTDLVRDRLPAGPGDWEAWMAEAVGKAVGRLHLATAEDLARLRARLEALEARVAEVEGARPPAAAARE